MLTASFRAQRIRFAKRPYDPTDKLDACPSTPKRSKKRGGKSSKCQTSDVTEVSEVSDEPEISFEEPEGMPFTPEQVTPPSKRPCEFAADEEPALVDLSGTAPRWKRIKETKLIQKRIKHNEWRVALPDHMKLDTRPSFHTLKAAMAFCNVMHGLSLTSSKIACSEEELGTINLDEVGNMDSAFPEFNIDNLFDQTIFEPAIPEPDPESLAKNEETKCKMIRIDTTPLKKTSFTSKFTVSVVPKGANLRPDVRVMASTVVGSNALGSAIHNIGGTQRVFPREFSHCLKTAFRTHKRPRRKFKKNPFLVLSEMNRIVEASNAESSSEAVAAMGAAESP